MADTNTKAQMTAHMGTYSQFLGWFKFGAIASALIAAVVVFLISR